MVIVLKKGDLHPPSNKALTCTTTNHQFPCFLRNLATLYQLK